MMGAFYQGGILFSPLFTFLSRLCSKNGNFIWSRKPDLEISYCIWVKVAYLSSFFENILHLEGGGFTPILPTDLFLGHPDDGPACGSEFGFFFLW